MRMKHVISSLLLGIATVASFAQWQGPTDTIPAFYESKPDQSETRHPILSGKQLEGEYFSHSYQRGSYKAAAKVSDRLFLMPCYCRCDRAEGHKSLHSCFEGTHGAVCATCMREATFVYEKTKQGWSVDQIRTGIKQGQAELVDLKKTYPEKPAR